MLFVIRRAEPDHAGIIQRVRPDADFVLGVAFHRENGGVGYIQNVPDMSAAGIHALPVKEDHVGRLGGVVTAIGIGILEHLVLLEPLDPLPAAYLAVGVVDACLIQAPVDKAGTPLVVIVIVVGNDQARIFYVVAATGLIHTVKVLGTVAFMVAELGERDAQDIVAGSSGTRPKLCTARKRCTPGHC